MVSLVAVAGYAHAAFYGSGWREPGADNDPARETLQIFLPREKTVWNFTFLRY